MSKSKRRSNRVTTAATMLLIAAAGTVALALYVKMTPADRVRTPGSDQSPHQPNATPPSEVQNVLIPVPRREGDRLSFESMEVPVAGGDVRVAAVNAFLKDSGLADASVRLESVSMNGGEADLHFSEGIGSGEGSMDEATLVYGLRAVMGQFTDVALFRIFSGDTRLEELGHFELGNGLKPIPVSQWGDPAASGQSTTSSGPPPSMPR